MLSWCLCGDMPLTEGNVTSGITFSQWILIFLDWPWILLSQRLQCRFTFQSLTFQASVSEVIDAEAGIYLLNNGLKLYITFLKDLTGELWSEDQTENFSDSRVTKHCAKAPAASTPSHPHLYNCLAPGDTLKILRCHYVSEGKKVALLCCGQSHIANERQVLL